MRRRRRADKHLDRPSIRGRNLDRRHQWGRTSPPENIRDNAVWRLRRTETIPESFIPGQERVLRQTTGPRRHDTRHDPADENQRRCLYCLSKRATRMAVPCPMLTSCEKCSWSANIYGRQKCANETANPVSLLSGSRQQVPARPKFGK